MKERMMVMLQRWSSDAACSAGDIDPELFFPTGKSHAAQQQIMIAKRVCETCPVVEACREWALGIPSLEGVWGGLSEAERTRIRRRRRRQAAADSAA